MAPLKMTITIQLVLRALLADPDHETYGQELQEATGLATGTIHPILRRLAALGWLESRWEDVDPHTEGRPRRRYYRLTRAGRESASRALATASYSIDRTANSSGQTPERW